MTERIHLFTMSRNRQLENVEIIVADISTFEMEASYDRIFSIEMFEVKLSLRYMIEVVLFYRFG